MTLTTHSSRRSSSISRRLGATLLCFSLLALSPTASLAAPINHGDFSGDTIDFLDVTEDSITDTPPLFGAPTVSGDSLDFNPVGFASFSEDGGVDVTDGQLLFMIKAKDGNGINSLLMTEAGDVSLAGFGDDTTFASVVTNITVDILETDQGPVNVNHQTSMTFVPSAGDFGLGTDGLGGPTFDSNWSGAKLIEFGAILAANGHSGKIATKVNINLDNVLTAISQNGTVATIAKKDVDTSGLTIEINKIPEPTTLLLAITGLFALAGTRRRG